MLEISEGSTNGNQQAHSLYSAATNPKFLLCLFLISKYSEILEPISTALQKKEINLLECQNHIKHLISVFQDDRDRNSFDFIFDECQKFCNEIGVEIIITYCRKTDEKSQLSYK